jgi:nucleotide-binding universal stress UspA family protein
MENYFLQDFKNILVPLDGSRISENALRYGVSIASKYNAGIVLVSVFSSRSSESSFRERIKEMNPKLAEDVEKMPLMYWMETYHEILKKAISPQKTTVKSVLRDANVSTKSVVDVLLDVVEKEKIDLVIISSHGKSGFKKLKLGSVTEELMKSLLIPVLCVKK